MTSRKNVLVSALVTATVAATLGAVGAAPAQADTCGHMTPNRSGGSAEVQIDAPMRSGPYASCGVLDRAGLTVSQYVALDCWMTNAHGNIWWAVNTYNGHRWVYNENFYGTPPARSAATRC
ncbi:hypothetical protein [Cellulomonas terrae]|uniref:SH3b domain-containing protein n=1 Tax=Cellulomonas terrae TaxID=311234 RepID=A0A511JJG9_9CELL|nr:hypothetical protein [Cellulomonas terrae]GEL98160.1 hypothetical protein CTE05_17070 [Cellulomonas terrae]